MAVRDLIFENITDLVGKVFNSRFKKLQADNFMIIWSDSKFLRINRPKNLVIEAISKGLITVFVS